jgi:hypothetical protein
VRGYSWWQRLLAGLVAGVSVWSLVREVSRDRCEQ